MNLTLAQVFLSVIAGRRAKRSVFVCCCFSFLECFLPSSQWVKAKLMTGSPSSGGGEEGD
jgi:hypothetical protein